jgi:hypothetical protein
MSSIGTAPPRLYPAPSPHGDLQLTGLRGWVVRRPLAVKNAYGATTGDSTDHCAQHVATAFNGEAVRRGRFHINQQEFGKLFSGGRLFRVFKIISLDRRTTTPGVCSTTALAAARQPTITSRRSMATSGPSG